MIARNTMSRHAIFLVLCLAVLTYGQRTLSCSSDPVILGEGRQCVATRIYMESAPPNDGLLPYVVQRDSGTPVLYLPSPAPCIEHNIPFTVTIECATNDTGAQEEETHAFVWQRDASPPLIAGVVDVLEVGECGELPTLSPPTNVRAMDECTKEIPVQFETLNLPRAESTCSQLEYDTVSMWSAADDCGNRAAVTHRLQVRDTRPPEILLDDDIVATDETHTMECEPGVGFADLPAIPQHSRARDTCDPNAINVHYNERTIPSGRCTTQYRIERSWSAQDACGNEKKVTHTFQMQDSGAPELGTDIDVCVWPPTRKAVILTDMADTLARLIRPDPCDGDYGYAILPNGYCHRHDDDASIRPPCFVDGQTIYVMTEEGVSPSVYLVDYILIDQCGNERPGQFELIVPQVPSETSIARCTATVNRAHITINTQQHADTHEVVKNAQWVQYAGMPVDRIEKYASLYGLSPHNSLESTRLYWESDERIQPTITAEQATEYLDVLQQKERMESEFTAKTSSAAAVGWNSIYVLVGGAAAWLFL